MAASGLVIRDPSALLLAALTLLKDLKTPRAPFIIPRALLAATSGLD